MGPCRCERALARQLEPSLSRRTVEQDQSDNCRADKQKGNQNKWPRPVDKAQGQQGRPDG